MYNYFSNFPVISYNGALAVNALAKVKFTNVAKNLGAIYYPYTVLEGERPDTIAASYYEDPRYSWIIYLANDIIDPYYDWVLSDDEFKRYINKKYGSLENSYMQIAYWEDNWYLDDSSINTSGYNALPANLKKYWKPVLDYTGKTVSYSRNSLELAVETNKIIEVTVANSAGFAAESFVTQNTSGVRSGSGFIKTINDNTLVMYNILGSFSNTGGSVGNLSVYKGSTSSAVTNVVTINNAIPEDEAGYWTYVSAYDYESQINEQKRFIRLIDNSYVDQIEKEMSGLL